MARKVETAIMKTPKVTNEKSPAKRTEKMMKYVEAYLVKTYGAIQPEWQTTLLILENSLVRYFQVKDYLDIHGIVDDNGVKSPLLTTEKETIATLLKISQKLGISPWDSSKIKLNEGDDTEDFIESLTQ